MALQGVRADDAVLVAYLVVEPGTNAVSRTEVRLREHLPDHLVPDRFVHVDALPLTHNGKIDRAALADLPESPEVDGGTPRTEIERAITAIWCEILNLPDVGREESFFALGGQSLQAGRMEARIRGRLGVVIPLRVISDHPTIAELAQEITRSRGSI